MRHFFLTSKIIVKIRMHQVIFFSNLIEVERKGKIVLFRNLNLSLDP